MTHKSLILLALVCLFQAPAHSEVILKKGKASVVRDTRDKTSCFPKKLNDILLKISRHFGRPVHVVSGYRSPKDNERRGGAKKSQHIHCKAADFTVPGASTKAVGKYLARMKERGGAGFYCRGRFHVDVASRRHWGGCVASYISFDGDDLILGEDEKAPHNYEGEIILEEEESHGADEDMNDYDEGLYYQDLYEI